MDADGQLRNLRDFLLVYNRMTEICFQRCTSNFNYRTLTMDEERCVDNCAGKLIRTNHRLMGTYVQLMPAMVQKRMDEMEKKSAEMAKAEIAASESSSTGTASAAEMPAAGESEHHIVPMQSASNNTADVQTPTPDVSAVGDAYSHFGHAIKSPDVGQTFDNRTDK